MNRLILKLAAEIVVYGLIVLACALLWIGVVMLMGWVIWLAVREIWPEQHPAVWWVMLAVFCLQLARAIWEMDRKERTP